MIDDPPTEQDVRQMLQRRAGDATPSPDAWAEIEARLAGGDGGGVAMIVAPSRPARRLPTLLMAAAVVIVLGFAAVVVARPDGTQVGTSPAGTPSTGSPTTLGGYPPTLAVWPAITTPGLQALQADADAGRRPDLLDPRAAAGQYLSDRFLAVPGRRVDFEVKDYLAGDNQSGEVAYVADGLPGSVIVRRLGGEGSIWYVVALTSMRLPIIARPYSSTLVQADVQPTADGRLEITTFMADGSLGPESAVIVSPGLLVQIGQTTDGAAAIVQLQLTGTDGKVSLAEVRMVNPEPTPYAYCKARYDVSGERPVSYVGSDEHLADIQRLIDAAPPAVVADLGAYRAFVADDVSPADPTSQEPVNWPPSIRERIQRIDAHDTRVCAAWEGP